MNNLTFGNDTFSHYETLGGGAGAIVGYEGTSAVQVHMTNTAITDPEIMESIFQFDYFPIKSEKVRVGLGIGREGMGLGACICLRKQQLFLF